MSMPFPPGYKPTNRERPGEAIIGSRGPLQDAQPPPPPPPIETPQGKLTEDEVSFILRTSLLAEHHEDPNVLRFISEYMKSRDQSQAAKAAGLHPQAGRALRSRPDIHLAIKRLTEKSVDKYGFDASEIVEKVKEIVMIDPVDLENPDGTFKHMREMRPEVRRAIKKFKAKNFYENDPNGIPVFKGQILEIEFHDKLKSAELLGREKEIFKETKKVEHDVTSNMASLLLESKDRAERRVAEIAEKARSTPAQIEAPRDVIDVEET